MLQHKIIDLTTGEETLVDYTAEEMAAVKAALAAQEVANAEAAAKEAARQAVLDKLGLTADEAAALLG